MLINGNLSHVSFNGIVWCSQIPLRVLLKPAFIVENYVQIPLGVPLKNVSLSNSAMILNGILKCH